MNGPGAETVVEVTNLVKCFGEVRAVDGISFSVAAGSTTALLGGNGAGKTTTISILLGLLLPTSGEVSIFGDDMIAHRHRMLPRMNFSSPYVDLPRRLLVRENLTVYGHLYGLDHVKDRIAALARDLEIEAFLDKPTGTLSAGQKTRVTLAKALLNTPQLLLLDEPTASLDPDTGDWVRSYLEDYQRRTGATLLLASHHRAEVERMCSQVFMLRTGVIVDQGAPTDLVSRYGRSTLEEGFLDIARRRRPAAGERDGEAGR